jgi:uncharacterized protein (TIGR03067 family)
MRVRLVPLIASLIAVAAAGFVPLPKPKPKKVEAKKLSVKDLEGNWTIVSYEYRTVDGVVTTTPYEKVDIKDGKWVKRGKRNGQQIRPIPYAIKIDTTKPPFHIDLSLPTSRTGRAVWKGLFRVEGDRLTVTKTEDNNRPASVDGELAIAQLRLVLKREKP